MPAGQHETRCERDVTPLLLPVAAWRSGAATSGYLNTGRAVPLTSVARSGRDLTVSSPGKLAPAKPCRQPTLLAQAWAVGSQLQDFGSLIAARGSQGDAEASLWTRWTPRPATGASRPATPSCGTPAALRSVSCMQPPCHLADRCRRRRRLPCLPPLPAERTVPLASIPWQVYVVGTAHVSQKASEATCCCGQQPCCLCGDAVAAKARCTICVPRITSVPYFLITVQAVQDVVSLIQRVSPAVVVLELDPERERKLLEQVGGPWLAPGRRRPCLPLPAHASAAKQLACCSWCTPSRATIPQSKVHAAFRLAAAGG